jgi:transcription antitermination factor NusG
MTWFAVQTHANQEPWAARCISGLGIAWFYPWTNLRRNRRKGSGVVTEWVPKPYYPRYVFAQCGADDVHRINEIPLVIGVVAFGGKPRPIPDAVMQVIMAGAKGDGLMGSKDEVSRARFEAAERVKFVAGSPMAGVVARILADDGQRDVRVLLSMMGAERELMAPAASLERVA